MRRAQVSEFGGAELIEVVEVDVPDPGSGELLVRVETAGVNPLDYKLRDGSSGAVQGFTDFPLPLGRECYGVVEAVGPDCTLTPGTPVLGLPRSYTERGTHADFVVLAEDEVGTAPAGVDPLLLGGVPIAGLTAWHTVHDIAEVTAGQQVLVIGAGGGVGQWLVQLCLRVGATVHASASTQHGERLTSYGATHIDYTTTDAADVVPPLDVVFDGVYFDTFEPALDLLKPDGRMVAIPTLADLAPAQARGLWAAKASLPADRSALTDLAGMVASGEVAVEVGRALPLDQLAEAHRILEDGHARGKVVVDLRA